MGFSGGLVVENLSCNAGDAGLIPGWETRIPHAMGQLSLRATSRSSCIATKLRALVPQQKIPRAATKTQHSQNK